MGWFRHERREIRKTRVDHDSRSRLWLRRITMVGPHEARANDARARRHTESPIDRRAVALRHRCETGSGTSLRTASLAGDRLRGKREHRERAPAAESRSQHYARPFAP